MPDHNSNLFVLDIFGTNFEPDGNTFEFPVVELPSRVVVISEVDLNANISLFQVFEELICSVVDAFFFSLERNGNNDDLNVGYSGRKHKTLVIAVVHHHNTDRPSGKPPTGLPDVFLLFLLVFEDYFEHFCKILAEVVGSCGLDGSSVLRNPGLNR